MQTMDPLGTNKKKKKQKQKNKKKKKKKKKNKKKKSKNKQKALQTCFSKKKNVFAWPRLKKSISGESRQWTPSAKKKKKKNKNENTHTKTNKKTVKRETQNTKQTK